VAVSQYRVLIGMWWAYVELGWGGYWAWDPVEKRRVVAVAGDDGISALVMIRKSAAC